MSGTFRGSQVADPKSTPARTRPRTNDRRPGRAAEGPVTQHAGREQGNYRCPYVLFVISGSNWREPDQLRLAAGSRTSCVAAARVLHRPAMVYDDPR